jgi:hypothetical protein
MLFGFYWCFILEKNAIDIARMLQIKTKLIINSLHEVIWFHVKLFLLFTTWFEFVNHFLYFLLCVVEKYFFFRKKYKI